MQGRPKLYFISFDQTQKPFAIECLKRSPVDFCILGLIGIILVIFILSALTAIIILLLNLGLTTFSVISDTFNGLIDLGVPEGVNILHFSAKSGNTKGYFLCSDITFTTLIFSGCAKIMKWQDSYIFKYTAHGESAFMKAAEMGHSKTVEEIIRKAKVNPLSGTRQIEAIKMAVHQVQIENNKYAFT